MRLVLEKKAGAIGMMLETVNKKQQKKPAKLLEIDEFRGTTLKLLSPTFAFNFTNQLKKILLLLFLSESIAVFIPVILKI